MTNGQITSNQVNEVSHMAYFMMINSYLTYTISPRDILKDIVVTI